MKTTWVPSVISIINLVYWQNFAQKKFKTKKKKKKSEGKI